MVTNCKCEQLPIFVAPSGRNGHTKKKFAGGFLGRLASIRVADAVQASRRQQNAAKSGIAERRSGFRTLEGIKDGHGDAGNLGSAAHMGINGAGGGAQASQSGGLNTAIRGEAGAPSVPEAGLSKSELAICLDALFALAFDEFLPETERSWISPSMS